MKRRTLNHGEVSESFGERGCQMEHSRCKKITHLCLRKKSNNIRFYTLSPLTMINFYFYNIESGYLFPFSSSNFSFKAKTSSNKGKEKKNQNQGWLLPWGQRGPSPLG